MIKCAHCGEDTSAENLRCIYCGEMLKKPVGAISGLVWGWKGWAGLVLGLLVLTAFLILIL